MKDSIITAISEALSELGIEGVDAAKIVLERPADMAHGDFATSIALVMAPKVKKAPLGLAIEILEKLKAKNLPNIEKMEVAGHGFINFSLTRDAAMKEVSSILSVGAEYGKNKKEAGKKIIFDYTDPNPFKVFHIGHLMTNIIGEAVARITEAQGADVKRFCYQGDVGRHVALTMWGLRFMPTHEMLPEETAPLSEKVSYFGKAYALGATRYKELEEEAQAGGLFDADGRPTSPDFAVADGEVRKLNKEIYERSSEQVNILYDKGREWSLEHFEELYAILGTKFDQYFFESQTTPVGLKLVQENTTPKGKGIFEESNAAVIFPGEKYDLHTRVFVNRDGLPTYEGKDLGLVVKKREACDFDMSIIITANEQSEYFKVVYKATELLFPELAGKSSHISHGMMQFVSGKMSSRTGNVVSGESLLMDMIAQAHEKMNEREMSDDEKKKTAEQVAVAAIKYTMLHQSVGKNIVFDPNKSLSFEGDSGPYLQYSCVRARAVLSKAEKEGVAPATVTSSGATASEAPIEIGAAGEKLEKFLGRFPEIIERSWAERSPHHIAGYLVELAGMFNSFYANTQIVVKEDVAVPYKVALTKAFSVVMENGLNLLGIKVPDKM